MGTELMLNTSEFDVSFEEKSHALTIRNTIHDMVGFTKSLVVDNDVAYKKVTSLYRQAREWKKVIDTKRKEMTEPLRKQTSVINDKAKELTDPLDEVIDLANSKSGSYLKLLEETKRQEDTKLRQCAALFDAEDDIYIPAMETTLRGDGAMAITKTEKAFKLIDITKVPAKYLMIDEAALRKDLKLGIGDIPGLELYETTTTQLRIR